jgi:hypothetical protein
MYVTQTSDDLSIMSIHFYDNAFEPYIEFGTSKSTILSMLASKIYRAQGTLTGTAINQTIDKIVANGFKNGVPKILAVLTDGVSYDSVI